MPHQQTRLPKPRSRSRQAHCSETVQDDATFNSLASDPSPKEPPCRPEKACKAPTATEGMRRSVTVRRLPAAEALYHVPSFRPHHHTSPTLAVFCCLLSTPCVSVKKLR